MEEIWKDIPGYEGYYQASNLGRVRSIPRMRRTRWPAVMAYLPGVTLSPYYDKGYQLVTMRRDGASRIQGVHRLVLTAFVGANPPGSYHCNHINGIRDDNRVQNLEWTTPAENAAHAVKTGLTRKKGADNANSKLTNEKVLDIRRQLALGVSQRNIADQFGVDRTLISHIKHGRIWTHA